MEIGTGLTILGTALGGKEVIVKILGPTAEYIGDGLKDFAQKRVDNIQNIFKNAHKKIGDKIDDNARVSPKILKGILNEGSFADDFLSVEYFGGVLASSRTGISRDDRGVFFNYLISRMSTYQLRTHYIFYHCLKKTFNGENINWGFDDQRSRMRLFIPISSFVDVMDFTKEERYKLHPILDHIVNGLLREQLIDPWHIYGELEDIKKYFLDASEKGIILQPNKLGFELFYWAYGKGQENPRDFLNEDVVFQLDNKITIDDRIKRITASNKN